MHWLRLLSGLFLCLALATPIVAAPSFTISEVGVLSGNTSSNAAGLNDARQVAGSSSGGLVVDHAILWYAGGLTDVGAVWGGYSYGYDINNSSVTVGYGQNPAYADRGFMYMSGFMMTDLGHLGGNLSFAYAINENWQVAGHSPTPTSQGRAFLYSWGNMQDLGTLGYTSYAYGLNDTGDVVGCCVMPPTLYYRAFLYSGGVMTNLGTLDPNGGTAYQTGSVANGINTAGTIVGRSHTASGAQHAFIYSGGAMSDLGTLGGNSSNARRISETGQVVGSAQNAAGQYRACLWEDGVTYDLNDLIPAGSGWTLTSAADINGRGDICGTGINPSGETRGFLLTRVDRIAPTIISWASSATHGATVGAIALPVSGAFTECRSTGLSKLLVTFSEPLHRPTVNNSTSGISVVGTRNGDQATKVMTPSLVGGNTMVIDFYPALPDGDTYTVTIPTTVTDLGDNPVTGNRACVISALAGDATSDKRANTADLYRVQANLNMAVTAATARNDMTGDGRINTADLYRVQANLGHTAP